MVRIVFSIVLPEKADRVEKFAAEELKKYLTAISRDEFVINTRRNLRRAIYVDALPISLGPDASTQISAELSEMSDDAFIIRSVDDSLLILGKTPRATLFGVYHYLQTLGARWYFPGKDNEYVPKKRRIKIKDLNIKEVPAFAKRGIVFHYRNTALHEWIDFAAKVKLNTIALHSLEGIDQMKELLADRGLNLNLEIHLFGSKFCSKDHETLEEGRTLVKNILKSLPADMDEFFLWQADVDLKHCDCEQDRELSVADQTLLFMNRMLQTIREDKPTARLAFLAYWSTWQRLRNIKPVVGVFLEMAPIHQCFSHSICDPSCAINREKVLPVIEDLLTQFNPNESQVLGYWLDASLFGRGIFIELDGRLPQFSEMMKEDIKYYWKKEVRAITTFTVGLDREYFSKYTSPTIFLYALLLWNPETDLKTEIATFCENFYGRESLARAFELREQIDPRDLNPRKWKDYSEKVSRSIKIAEKALNKTTSEVAETRLRRLLQELSHVRRWLELVEEKMKTSE